jgi:hypothetical protein
MGGESGLYGVQEEMEASRYFSEQRQQSREGLIDHPNPWVRAAAFAGGLLVIAAEAGAEIFRSINHERESNGS